MRRPVLFLDIDGVFDFPPTCAELIACDGNRGLGPSQMAALKHWLGAPPD